MHEPDHDPENGVLEKFSAVELENFWAQDYPGQSHTIRTFRHDLVFADLRRRETHGLFHQLEVDLYLTGLPPFHWDPFTRQCLIFFKRLAASDQQEYRRAFKLLHSLRSATPSASASKSKPESEPEAEPVPNSEKAGFDQHVWVTIAEDGQVHTRAEPPASFFLKPDVQALGRTVRRHYFFRDQIVPDVYAFVLEHEGTVHEPAHHVYIRYFEEDFRAICQREIDTNSPYLLDGPRRSHHTCIDIPYVDPVYQPRARVPVAE